MDKFFRVPFGQSGDKADVPDALVPGGDVSFTEGYGAKYQLVNTDPSHKNIERDKMNYLFNVVTRELGILQAQGVPDFITTTLNGGAPFPYAIFSLVRYSGSLWLSIVAANTATPGTDITKWHPVDLDVDYKLKNSFGATIFAPNYVVKVSPPIADNALYSFHVNRTVTATGYVAFVDSTAHDYTGVGGSVSGLGFVDRATTIGTKDVANIASFSAEHTVTLNVANTATEVSSFNSAPVVSNCNVTAVAAFRARNVAGSGGTLATLYGLLIDNLTRGAENWGVYVNTVKSFFGGVVHFGVGSALRATIQFDAALDALRFDGRAGGAGVKIVGGNGDRKLRLGVSGSNTDDAVLEQIANGDLNISTKAGQKVNILSPVVLNGSTFTSALTALISGNTQVSVAHGLGVKPISVSAWLECINPAGDNGWLLGDQVQLVSGAGGSYACYLHIDATNITFHQIGGGAPVIFNGTNSGQFLASNSNWRFVFKASSV